VFGNTCNQCVAVICHLLFLAIRLSVAAEIIAQPQGNFVVPQFVG